jgi:hypothetical protein
MRRICSMLLVGCGAWAQQPAAKTPPKADAPLTLSSFSASGLHNERVLTNLFIGNFADIPFSRDNVAFAALFENYLESYGRHCDAYLPPNKVEMMQRVCAVEQTQIDRYGTRVGTGHCLQYSTEGMGIYADPTVYAAKNKLGEEAGPSMIKDAFQAMKQTNPLGAALNTLNETLQMASDMDGLFRLNSCVSPGVKRLQENIVLFSMGKQPIVLPGAVASIAPKAQPAPGGPFKDQNYTKLLEDLILDQSRTWLMNRFVSGSTSNVVVSSRDSVGRPAKIVGRYLFNDRSQGSVTLSFSDGIPDCMYFFDLPSTCKTPNRRIVVDYSSGGYQQLGPPGGVSAANPAPSPAAGPPIQPAPDRGASAKAVAPAAPAGTVNPSAPPAPALTAAQQREQQAAENQKRAEKVTACRATFQQGLKDHPEASAGLAKEYTSCVQGAVQPAKGRVQ